MQKMRHFINSQKCGRKQEKLRDLVSRMDSWQTNIQPTCRENAAVDKLQEELCDQIKDVLSGKKNAGKFITTTDYIDILDSKGIVHSWKIEPIDQKFKDFADMQVKIKAQAESASTSGLNLHPSLSNILINGKLASGSEMLYALKIHLATQTSSAEAVIFEDLNRCLKINFPKKSELNLGFYHSIIKTEDSISSDDRMKNNV